MSLRLDVSYPLAAPAGTHQFGTNAGGAVAVALNAASGFARIVAFRSGGVDRWRAGADDTAEGGANAGTHYHLQAFDDLGAVIDTPILVRRSAGNTITLGGATARPVVFTGNVLIAAGKNLQIGNGQVLGNRKTGWAQWTGTAARAAKATGTATLADVAQALKALIDDLMAHGLIGT